MQVMTNQNSQCGGDFTTEQSLNNTWSLFFLMQVTEFITQQLSFIYKAPPTKEQKTEKGEILKDWNK